MLVIIASSKHRVWSRAKRVKPVDRYLKRDGTMIDLTGKVVFITGAAGEIGTATARTMAAAGARLVLHDLGA